MPTIRQVIPGAVLALALLLPGCDGQPTAPLPGTRPTAPQTVRQRDSAAAVVARLKAMNDKLETFSAVIKFWETDGKKIALNTADVYTARPGKIRANVTESNDLLKRGAKMVYLGDKKVTVKIGFIKQTYAYTDYTVTSLRGWRIDQTDLQAMIGGIADPANEVKYLGPATSQGVAGEGIEVTGPNLLPGVSRETAVIGTGNSAPLELEAWVGQQKVYRIDLTQIKLNPVLPPDIFKI